MLVAFRLYVFTTGTMNEEKIIVSMTSWPPRYQSAAIAMKSIVHQCDDGNLHDRIKFVLVLSEDECCSTYARKEACELMDKMEALGVEIIIDKGNIRSHKKLIPTLEKYTDNPILVVDDDIQQERGWLRTFIADHDKHPDEIIYGNATSRIKVEGGKIIEDRGAVAQILSKPGQPSIDLKPANGAAGTLYPAHTFTDGKFFDRELFMRVSPTSDETWQWAFAVIGGKQYRCLSAHNIPNTIGADQQHALYNINRYNYNEIHNAIADAIPLYKERLIERLATIKH